MVLPTLRFLCAATLKLVRLFRKERYDIVYVHTMPDLLVLVDLSRSSSGPGSC
jgi:hypothetical protein